MACSFVPPTLLLCASRFAVLELRGYQDGTPHYVSDGRFGAASLCLADTLAETFKGMPATLPTIQAVLHCIAAVLPRRPPRPPRHPSPQPRPFKGMLGPAASLRWPADCMAAISLQVCCAQPEG